jgi:hypothetical protein
MVNEVVSAARLPSRPEQLLGPCGAFVVLGLKAGSDCRTDRGVVQVLGGGMGGHGVTMARFLSDFKQTRNQRAVS